MAPGVLVVVAGLFVVVLVGIVAVASLGRPVPARTCDQDAALLRAAARKEGVVRVVGLVVGAWAGLALAGWDRLGRGILLSAPVAALVVAVSVAAGQFLLRPRAATIRTASLVPRRIRDYLPTWLSRAVLAATVYLLAFLAIATVASPNGLHRLGQEFGSADVNGLEVYSGPWPWPGSFYLSVPIVVIVAAGLTITSASLRWVALRPSLTDVAGAQADDVLRRRASRVLVAATGVLVTVPALGVGLAAAQVLHTLSSAYGAPLWWSWVQVAIGVIELPLLALLVWCGTLLLAPSVGEFAGRSPAKDGAPVDTAAPGGRSGA
jgi:hypothetical protein